MRLIDADALERVIKTECNPYGKPTIDFESGKRVLKIIDNAPTAIHDNYCMGYQDGVRKVLSERQQGEWIDEGQYAEGHSKHAYSCKNCGYHIIAQSSTILENLYCKHCGADMRKGVRKNETN